MACSLVPFCFSLTKRTCQESKKATAAVVSHIFQSSLFCKCLELVVDGLVAVVVGLFMPEKNHLVIHSVFMIYFCFAAYSFRIRSGAVVHCFSGMPTPTKLKEAATAQKTAVEEVSVPSGSTPAATKTKAAASKAAPKKK